MAEFGIEFQGTRRPDGSVLFISEDLPLFSVVGANEGEARKRVLQLLPDYLKANFPEYVSFRTIESAGKVIFAEIDVERISPIYAIVEKGATPSAAENFEGVC